MEVRRSSKLGAPIFFYDCSCGAAKPSNHLERVKLMRRIIPLIVMLSLVAPLRAAEANPSSRQRELVIKLMKITNSDATAAAMADGVFSQIQKQFIAEAQAKGNSAEDIAEANELFDSFRTKASKIDVIGLMREESVRIYSKYFTEQELADLVAFYETPLGMKTVKVLPQLLTESIEAGARIIGPKFEEVMRQTIAENEKKHPWRQTMADMRSVATAVEAYATDNNQYPAGDYAAIKSQLVPTYLKTFPDKDVWGNAYAYVVSPDHMHYRIISSGADSNFEWDSRRVVVFEGEPEARYRDRLEDDLIYQDGWFLQLPVQTKR
jgi:hypothetical protein